jgi:hypothetical protein
MFLAESASVARPRGYFVLYRERMPMPGLSGEVRLTNGLVANGLRFQVLRQRFGSDPELIAEVTTDDVGKYEIPDVEVDARSTLVAQLVNDNATVLTPVAATQETGALNLLAPVAAMSPASEFVRLKEALAPVVGDRSLAHAVESDDRFDITVAHRESGWDARLIAVSALAAQLSDRSETETPTGLNEDVAYGLLRAGMPSNRAQLAQIPAETVKAALDKAASAGIIDLDETGLATAVEQFEQFAVNQKLDTRPAGGLASVRDMLDASKLPTNDERASQRSRFQSALLDVSSDVPLWERAAKAGVNERSIKTLQSQAKLAFLTNNNLPLMQVLQDGIGDASLGTALATESWDKPEVWARTIQELGGKDHVPAAYINPDAEDDDPVATYAEELARRVRVAYPTHVVSAMVERGDLVVPEAADDPGPVVQTLRSAAEAGFELGESPVAGFLAAHPSVYASDDPAVRAKIDAGLNTLHRTYQLSPSNDAMKVLLDNGLGSAFDVVAMSEAQFMDRYGQLFPSQQQARLTYRKSEQVTAILYNFYTMSQQAAAAPILGPVSGQDAERVASIERIKQSLPPSPTMESLFGSMDFCECDHCGSVLGPAAYLVDLLKFLDHDANVWQGFLADWARRHNGESYPFGTPYEELMARRPDLAHLALTCDNTNTVLPTIDLVNEILEFFLANGSLTAQAVHDSGRLPSPEVLIEPEFIEAAVYDGVLRTSTYPQILPFDLWHETVRAYTDWLDAPLTRLVELFHPAGVDGTFAAAAERLGLTSVEAAALTADDPMDKWWTRFGFDEAAAGEAAALSTLSRAKPLSLALGVSYQGLVDLLGSRYANPGLRDLAVLATADVSVSDAVVWRANQAMLTVPDPPTDPTNLRIWTTVRSAQRRLETVTAQFGLTGPRAADAWLLAIPDAVFDSVVVLLDPDASCSFELTTVGTASTGAPLADADFARLLVKLDLFVRLQRRLGWTTAELDSALGAFVTGGTDAPAMFGAPMRTALVYLAGQQRLAQLLEFDGDRRRLTALWAELDPAVHNAMFVDRPAQERDPAMAGPLGDILSADSVGAGAGAAVAAHLPVLQSGLGITAAEITAVLGAEGIDPATEPLSAAVVAALHRHALLAAGLGWSIADVLILRRLSGIAPFLPLATDVLADPADDHIAGATLAFVTMARSVDASGLSIAEVDLLAASRFDPEGELRPDLDALSSLLDAVTATLAGAAPDQPDTVSRLVNQIAAAVGQPPGLLFALLTDAKVLRDPGVPASPLIDAYLTLAEPAADRTRARNAHLLLTRMLMLADRLDLDVDEIAEFGLGTLPIDPVNGVAPQLGELLRLLAYHALRGAAVGGSGSLLAVLQDGGRATSLAAFAQLTRRDVATATAVADALSLTVAKLGTVAGLEQLWEVAALVGRVGVPPETLAGWTAIVAADTTADTRHRIIREVKDAVRSHGATEIWLRVAKPINDGLRQRKRDALVGASLIRLGLSTTEELYERLLIDPGSEPVLQTSRIRQAISALQLFVQRCLLNIEPRVHPSAVNRDQWAWMKRYRVWETNRKIFLFPENWLEPEFRDDKSHLFLALESTLLQSDVTSDVVEDAFLGYLRKLDEIARLEVCGMYWDQDVLDPGATTLHVIGRTHGLPRQYFYRRMQHGMWTPWEPMNVDIDGDHIVPVVWRNRLHVFWVTFLEQPDSSDASPASDGNLVSQVKYGAGQAVVATGGAQSATMYENQFTVIGGDAGGGTPKKPKPLAEANVVDVKRSARGSGVSRDIQIALHWSEYIAGKWSPATASGFGRVPSFSRTDVFDPNQVFVHTSTVWDSQGNEAGVQVHLTGATIRTFLLRGRNSPPESGTNVPRPPVPFYAGGGTVNHYDGSGSFKVRFNQRLTSTNSAADVATPVVLTVLGATGAFSLLPSSNAVTIGGAEIGALVSPFFYADAQRTFFVEPNLMETTTETWEEWIVTDPGPAVTFTPGDLGKVNLVPYVPELVRPDWAIPDPDVIDPWQQVFNFRPDDVITSPNVGIVFGDRLLGPRGAVDVTFTSALAGGLGSIHIGDNPTRPRFPFGRSTIPVSDGPATSVLGDEDTGEGRLRPDVFAVVHPSALERAGLATELTHIDVIGSSGLAVTPGLVTRPRVFG